MPSRRWRPVPKFSRTEGHTADLWIMGEGPDCPSLLASMLESLYLVVSEEYELVNGTMHEFEVSGGSTEEALVRFLSEALYLLEGEGVLLTDPRIEATPEGGGLRIRVRAESTVFTIPERTGIEVKAVTYHDASLEIHDGGSCSARVLVDI